MLTENETAIEKARQLRYSRPACLSLNWQRMRNDLQEWGDDIYEATWMDGAYEALFEATGEDEESITEEFKIAFSALGNEMERMWEDMHKIEEFQSMYLYTEPDPEYDDPPMLFDMFFPAINVQDDWMGFDIVEHDYYSIEPSAHNNVREQARKRLKRLTKDQLLNVAGLCMEVARQYMSLKARYDGLNTSINILKGRHEEQLNVVKGIEELYEAAHEETDGFKYDFYGRDSASGRLDKAISQLPDRMWIEC